MYRIPFALFRFVLLGGLLLSACSGGAANATPTAVTFSPTKTSAATPAPTLADGPEGGVEALTATSAQTLAAPVEALTPTPAPTLADRPEGGVEASAFPDPAGYEWQEVISGLDVPIGLFNAADGSNRLFALEKAGRIRVIQGDKLLDQPFLDITDRVRSAESERGLLGLAFSPRYKEDGVFFVHYSDKNGDTTISRFKVTGDPNRADPASEQIILTQQQPYANHNGGEMAFGPDGFLYIGLGDGGSAGDPQNNGQNTDTLLGKLLRIDPFHGEKYAIPTDNPFAGGGGKPEVWAYGLRNPWRFSFDPRTGDLYIADVGQNQWEEIDYLPAGSPGGVNFGWRIQEATHPYLGDAGSAQLTGPVFEYDHSQGCSVTGGYVYRGAMPEWQGIYLFGDYCSANIWGLLKNGSQFTGQQLFKLPNTAITSFGQDEAGEIYLVNPSGAILRLAKK